MEVDLANSQFCTSDACGDPEGHLHLAPATTSRTCPGTYCDPDPLMRSLLDCECAHAGAEPSQEQQILKPSPPVQDPMSFDPFGDSGHGCGHAHGHGDHDVHSDAHGNEFSGIHPCCAGPTPCQHHSHGQAHGHGGDHGEGHSAHGHGDVTEPITRHQEVQVAGILATMDSIRQQVVPQWHCEWAKCQGAGRTETPQDHLMHHLDSTVRQAVACKLSACEGDKLAADEHHLHTHIQPAEGAAVRCTWAGQCTRRFKGQDELRKHLETHAQLDATNLACGWNHCTEVFADPSNLRQHLLQGHLRPDTAPKLSTAPDDGTCKWQQCTMTVDPADQNRAQILYEHAIQAHGGWITHTPERIIQCKWLRCNRFFVEKTKFSEHMRTHTGFKNVPCSEEGCDSTFTNKSQMRSHIKRHHEKQFKCDKCAEEGIDRCYTTAFNLREHLKVTHDKQDYTCPKCNRAYKSQKACSTHIRKCEQPVDGDGILLHSFSNLDDQNHLLMNQPRKQSKHE